MSSDEEMELPVVKTRIPQRNPPRPPQSGGAPPPVVRRGDVLPTTTGITPDISTRKSVPEIPTLCEDNNNSGPNSARASKRKHTNREGGPKQQVDQLRQQNERLRGLVTSLTSRLELLELNQYKLTDVCEEVQMIKEALNESPAFAKKDRSSVLDRSSLFPVLQQGTTSDASTILDLIQSDKAIYYSGYMNKKGRKVRNWKRRYFLLQGHNLSYYAKEGEKTPLGEINLETCMVDELKEREESNRACMALLVEGRKLLFCAESAEENLRWYLYLVCKNSELSYLRKLKHTNQLANNNLLQFLEQPMVTQLRLDNNTLSIDSVVALTCPVRIHDTLHRLSLRYSKLNDLAISTLCEALKSNKSIEILDLEGNNISTDGAKALSTVLDANTKLKNLLLKENKVGDKGVEFIAKVLGSGSNTHLEILDLTNNQIGEIGATSLGTALVCVKKISELMLDDNQVGNQGAHVLLDLCEKNSCISVLRLKNNGITDLGIGPICDILSRNTSLKRLYLSFNSLETSSCTAMIQTLITNRSLEFIEFSEYRLESTDLCSMRLLNDCNLLQF